MSKYTIKELVPSLYDKWNKFIEESVNGTIFHNLDFLNYHGDAFAQKTHHLIWFKGESIYAVMPMVILNHNGKKIAKSPYGGSFGGIVYPHQLKIKNALTLIELLHEYLSTENIHEMVYINTPYPYHKNYTNYIDYALLSHGFIITSRDIFNIIELTNNIESTYEKFEGRCRTTIKKHNDDFEIIPNVTIEEFYPILMEDKIWHNGSRPTHSFKELSWLKENFEDKIIFDIAVHRLKRVKTGICYFECNKKTIMTFYIAQENEARGLNGNNVLLFNGIKRAIERGFKYLDFGASTLGYVIKNIGVAEFKESFGARGYFRDTYTWMKK